MEENMEKLILLPVIAVCLTRTAGYGIYTAKERNISGTAGLFIILLAALGASVYFMMR